MTLRAENLYPTVAERWLNDIPVSVKSKRQYRLILRCLDDRCGERRFREITVDDVKAFIEVGENGAPRADRTRRQYLRIIASLYDWALDPDVRLADVNPAARLRATEPRRAARGARHKTWLGEDRAKALLATARAGGTATDRRDAYLLGLYLSTGLRCAELLVLSWGDVDLTSGTLRLTGKGGKMAVLALQAPARKLLIAWRTELVADVGHEPPAFWPLVPRVTLPGMLATATPRVDWSKRLRSASRVDAIVRERAAAIGLDHLAPHDLRRSFAGILDDRGVPLEDIRRAMRHSSEATTRIYLKDRPKAVTSLDDLDFG